VGTLGGIGLRLTNVSISGFRGYGDKLSFPIEEATTTVIGRNDAGKSSLFEALEIFFGGAKPEQADFTVGRDDPIRIACTFSELPGSIVIDAQRSTSLASEYLLNSDNQLELVKTWTRSKATAPVISAVSLHPVIDGDEGLINAKLPLLKSIANGLGIREDAIVDRRTSSGYRDAIWATALDSGRAALEQIEVPLTGEDGKQVGLALQEYLPLFHLFRADRPGSEADQLAQDPAKAAIKTVLDEHAEELKVLTVKVQEQVTALLADVVSRLAEVAPELASSLRPTEVGPSWAKAFSGLQFIDEHDVPLTKRGSGTRRLVLLSFFRATAERGIVDDPDYAEYHRGVITAVEEPETALHADLQSDIVAALQDVGDLPHRQVLLTTHSANLIRLVPAQSIRYITGERLTRRCVMVADDGDASLLLAELNKSLGVFTDHNVRCFLLVEGRNDITGLKTLSAALERAGCDGVSSLADLEAAGLVCFMPIGGGGSASLWHSNLSPFKRPEVHIMDSDRESAEHPLKPEMIVLRDRADEKRHVYVLDRRELENYLTVEAVADAYLDVVGFDTELTSRLAEIGDWHYVDVPNLCADIAHTVSGDTELSWAELASVKQKSKESQAKRRLARAFGHASVLGAITSEEPDALDALRRVTSLARAAMS